MSKLPFFLFCSVPGMMFFFFYSSAMVLLLGLNTQSLDWKRRFEVAPKRSSSCSLPDEPYSFVICGHKIHDSRMYERYRIYGNGKWVFFCWMVVWCQNVSHPTGNMPSTVCSVQGWFRWGTPFISVLFSVLFWSSFAPDLWAASGRSWLITCGDDNNNIHHFRLFYDCFRGPIDGSHLDMIHHKMT